MAHMGYAGSTPVLGLNVANHCPLPKCALTTFASLSSPSFLNHLILSQKWSPVSSNRGENTRKVAARAEKTPPNRVSLVYEAGEK